MKGVIFMDYKVIFDRNTPYWSKDDESNLMYIRHQTLYMTSLLRGKGYVYLNQIYESLGAEWNPENENPCAIYSKGNSIKFSIRQLFVGVFEVTISIQ